MANEFSSIPTVDAQELLKFLDIAAAARVVPMIYGPPGVGKSSVVAQWADTHGYAMCDIRLAQMLPEHIASIQYVSDDRRHAISLEPAIIRQVKEIGAAQKRPVVLLCDELTLASQETLSAALELILDRRVSGFALPDDCVIIAAGNRPQDTSSAMLLDPPVRSRMMSVVFRPSPRDTAAFIRKTFAGSQLAQVTADFVESTQGRPLMTSDAPPADAAFVTPRGIVSALKMATPHVKALTGLGENTIARMAFESSVGRMFFQSLKSYAMVTAALVDPDIILKSPDAAPQHSALEAMTAQLSSVMAAVMRLKNEDRSSAAQALLTYMEHANTDHLRIWAASLSSEAAETLTASVRGRRIFAEAGIASVSDAANLASAARSR